MLFNSYTFIFAFLPITFFIYFYLNSKKLTTASVAFLVFASLFFYSWWNILYLPLILASMLFNFVMGNYLSKPIKAVNKKAFLWFGIGSNVGLLGYFKYTDFLLDNFNGFFGASIPLPHIVLPLGISFFTFTQIAYLVDCYKNKVKEYDFIRYALFVTYFPHLLAGPILQTLPKAYIFVDTKAILWEKINEGEKDVFYTDDTHWSYKASEAISQYLFHEIPKYLE